MDESLMVLGEETKLKWLQMCTASNFKVMIMLITWVLKLKPVINHVEQFVCWISILNVTNNTTKNVNIIGQKFVITQKRVIICFINMTGYMFIIIKCLSNFVILAFLSHVTSRELCVSVSTVLTFWEWLPKSLCFHFYQHFMHCVLHLWNKCGSQDK